jgi:hypothetical protein
MVALHRYLCRLLIAGVLTTLGDCGWFEPLALAASAKSKKNAKPAIVQPVIPDQPVSLALPKKITTQRLTKTESSKAVVVTVPGQAPSDQRSRKTRRHRKAVKKWHSPAIVQPKPDLSYHGILKQPQRYDPSRDRRAGSAPNPQAGDVLHDHFQELDKNRDGMIDPFERAFGRLDMDRDVSNRQWE